MRNLYVSQQGCYLSLQQESVVVSKKEEVLAEVQLPLLQQILIFGKSQLTTQVIRSCLQRDIPIAYLSRMGYCYGRIMAIERGYRNLSRYQQQLEAVHQLIVARAIVEAKLKNSRVILQRQQRRLRSDRIDAAMQTLEYLIEQIPSVDSQERLFGFEGSGAARYFSAFGECLSNSEFVFVDRTRRPPGNPVNAMLSFGYQVLWNHLLALIEIQGLDPYQACLHKGHERHAALASDLIEEFRSSIVDSLVIYLVNTRIVNVERDFEYRDGGCYLNDSGRKRYMEAFLVRMEELIQVDDDSLQPRWDILSRQVRRFKEFVYNPVQGYQPHLIR